MDEDGNMEQADFARLIEASDKETMWWALYKMSSALHAARYEDPDCKRNPEKRGGLYSVVHYTADHWLPQIPGMPTAEAIAAGCAEDTAYHELTYAAERLGIRITGDEFIPR